MTADETRDEVEAEYARNFTAQCQVASVAIVAFFVTFLVTRSFWSGFTWVGVSVLDVVWIFLYMPEKGLRAPHVIERRVVKKLADSQAHETC